MDGKKNYLVHRDSDYKLLGKLNNIYMTRFKDGWIFDEIVGKKKELFKILNLPLPTCERLALQENDWPEEPTSPCDIEEIAEETTDSGVVDL